MTPILFAIVGGLVAVGAEVVFRSYRPTYTDWVLHGGLLAPIFVNYAVYRVLNSGSSFLLALVLFSLVTVLARIGASVFILHEPLRGANLVAAGALLIASFVGYIWRH